jgi:hypothetical protein
MAALALVLAGTGAPLLAQAGTASLTGAVTDEQGGALPGVTVTITSSATGAIRTTTTNESGTYQLLALPPGLYTVSFELNGFRTAVHGDVRLQVDSQHKLDVPMAIGSLSETVQVTTDVVALNTSDASLGNVITGQQVRTLPLEANNVIGLLSLQPGAVYLPNATTQDARTGAIQNIDPRSGAVSGSRADQSNITLDGIDVNDPQFGTAYSSALRMTLDSLQEFRVSTSNYGADAGRSSGAQVSLVTRSGSNDLHGSANLVQRSTRFSSNDYFLKLSQLQAGEPDEAPKLDKTIWGGSLGGPVLKDKLFFFGNYERLGEDSEAPVLRNIPSMTMRDGVLVYPCATPGQCPATTVAGFSASHAIPAGFHGMSPAELAAIDPLHIGPSLAASQVFQQYPVPNDPGIDGFNLVGYRFAAPVQNTFNTTIGRADYRMGNQSFFGRLNFQDDTVNSQPQFLGQPPRTTRDVTSRGVALGWDSVLSSTMVNTFRYGLTRIKEDIAGLQTVTTVDFRNIDDFNALTATSGRNIPTHTFIDDLSWVRGAHTFKFGTSLRFSRVGTYNNRDSFHIAEANGSWVSGVGRRFMPGGLCPGLEAVCDSLPAVAEGGQATYGDTLIPLLGIISEVDAHWHYDRDGSLLPVGTPIERRWASDEYEFYVQDSWKIGDTLTVSGGLRYSLYSPVYEVNGLQVAPDIKLGDWFEQRRALMEGGRSTSEAPLISFDLAGPKNGKPGFYDWDKNNFAPRVAAAWTPHAASGLLGAITGQNRLVVRGGYSIVYDRIGNALASNFDRLGSFGLATVLSSPFGGNNEDEPSIRFQGIDVVPPTLPEAPPGGFPATAPSYVGQITEALDGTIVTPYYHSFNFIVGRELGHGFTVEGGYVGRRGRNLLVRRDAAMPADLRDPQSGMDYFTAATQLIKSAETAGIDPGADPSAYAGLPAIPFWENMFPDAAGDGLTATQRMAFAYNSVSPDFITALYGIDEFCDPACSSLGPFAFFAPQYDSLAVQSSIGRSEYDALQLSLRKQFAAGYQFDINYTYAHAKDHGSLLEGDATFADFTNGGYTGFLLDSWSPDKQYGNADFDVRHLFNANWIADLPFGHGRKFGSDTPGWLNAIIGEWSTAGVVRLSSGFPFTVLNCRQCWTTNWNLQSNAELATPGLLPRTRTTRNVIDGYPSPFADPQDALTHFRRAYPGEVGLRNELRGDGYFSIDLSVSKGWTMPWSKDQRLRFRWDTFNLTNTPKFDVQFLDVYPDRANTFGRYFNTIQTCDGGAGRCMQFALRYEF